MRRFCDFCNTITHWTMDEEAEEYKCDDCGLGE